MAALLVGLALGAALVAVAGAVAVAAWCDRARQPEPTLWLEADR
jgi:hypothetical protein